MKNPFWQIFRLVFVIFSLYLMGDAFYRWDGFKYYASFSEFLPSVALASVTWSIVALMTAFMVWLLVRSCEWICNRIGFKIRAEHLLMSAIFSILLGALVWKIKKIFWPTQTVFQVKLAVFIGVVLVSLFIVWIFREKAGKWFAFIQERITPLIWLFGIIILLSIPLVAYTAWFSNSDQSLSKAFSNATGEHKSRPNVILVTFDALTARNMSAYGYQRETTPFIRQWAKQASLFTRLEAESNFTGPTAASLMTGKRVWTHQTFHNLGSIYNGNVQNLAFLLQSNGYFTMAYIENPNANPETLGISESFSNTEHFLVKKEVFLSKINSVFYSLFFGKFKIYNWILLEDFYPLVMVEEYFFNPIYKKFFWQRKIKNTPSASKASESITIKSFDKFLSDIEDSGLPEPYFVWIHVWPPHRPYLPPPPFKGMFESSQKFRTFDGQGRDFQRIQNHLLNNKPITKEIRQDINILRALYDEFIRYCDDRFQDFVARLKAKEMLENTMIVLSADHGEMFDYRFIEHGHEYLYEPLTHIPLIIKLPGQDQGNIISDLVEQIDIPATILDIANIPIPSWMEGRSLLPLLQGRQLTPKPAFSMYLEKNPTPGREIKKGVIAVWDGDYKLIHYLESNRSLLFNLKNDPDELRDIFNVESERGQNLLKLIHRELDRANKRIKEDSSLPVVETRGTS